MKKENFQSLLCIFLLNTTLVALDFFWFSFDYRIPSMDEAGHIMCCMDMQQKLNHIRPLESEWWHQLMTVNQLYPPVLYLTGGILRMVFRQTEWIDILTMQIFKITLWTSVFIIGRLCKFNQTSCVLAVIALASFPLVSVLSHTFFLEIPLLAGVAFAEMALLLWYANRNSKRALPLVLFAGTAIGLACLIKQPAGYFLLAPAVYLTLKPEDSKQNYKRKLAQATLIALIAMAVFLPWFLTNLTYFNFLVEKNVQAFNASQNKNTFFNYLIPYLNAFPRSISPLLFGTSIVGIFALKRETQLKILPFTLSSIFGILLLSTFTASENLSRYIIPGLIAPALYIGAVLGKGIHAKKMLIKVSAIFLIVILLFQDLSFSYFPYPMQKALPAFASDSINKVSSLTNTINSCPAGQLDWSKDNPLSAANDWAQRKVIQVIGEKSGKRPVWLNIMINTGQLNTRTFTYLCKIAKTNISPSTSRVWTITGDRVVFDQDEINRYDWYLFKTGQQGYRFVDQNSSDAALKIRQYVENSEYFKLVSSMDLPDKTKILLYQNQKNAHEK